uniref:Septin-type G domain-containing protein n=1 Tax=Ditylenchus dipsaci TaxID=166011 RepID=A0A915CKM6_9BILA
MNPVKISLLVFQSSIVQCDYINAFETYLKEELKIRRCLAYYDDTRIPACLYFISLRVMVPSLDTDAWWHYIRVRIYINIEIYQFPIIDETVRKENAALNKLLPFAIVGSTDFVPKEMVDWCVHAVTHGNLLMGIVEVENEMHCDFVKLREALLRINEDSLRERTHNILCRTKMMETSQQRQLEFKDEMKKREKQYSDEFQMRVSKKEAELKHREEVLNMRSREISEQFEKEQRNLEQSINLVMEEKAKLESSRNNSGGKKRK